MEENQTPTYFLRSRLFTYDIISTAISIKHRKLATFNINKNSMGFTNRWRTNVCVLSVITFGTPR